MRKKRQKDQLTLISVPSVATTVRLTSGGVTDPKIVEACRLRIEQRRIASQSSASQVQWCEEHHRLCAIVDGLHINLREFKGN